MAEDDYDSDEILSQALHIYEEYEENKIFFTQSSYRDVSDDEKVNILSILENTVDVSDMVNNGRPSDVGLQHRNPKVKRTHDEVTITTKKENPARFVLPSNEDVTNYSKPSIPENTRRKNRWAVNLFSKWRLEVLGTDSQLNPELHEILSRNASIIDLSDHELNIVLSVFVLALKKEDGTDYTPDSLFSIIIAIQRHFDVSGRKINFLQDPRFNQLKNCLDNAMQNKTKQGLGIHKKQASIITPEQENILWELGLLGISNPQTLLNTVFWMVGVNFGLRGGVEHRNLYSTNFNVFKDSNGKQYLEYCENVSKTFKGGLKHGKIEPHRARAYAIENSPRCPVQIYKLYISKLHPNSDPSNFYYQPLTKPSADIWFSHSPIGHNKLQSVVKNITTIAGFEGFYTNHSLRATTATRLFQNNVPEQLIMAQTGHRSTAVYGYKRPSDEQKQAVSKSLQSEPTTTSTSATVIEVPNTLTSMTSSKVFNITNSEVHFHLNSN